ncbi:hypothetical protein SDC9_151827 [bioreactor metagenome]|uniref:Uncharacterized protein n=1 Tax=bioreactor metagenome TaxID=1076179 RepID=A0A645ET36_9ZZZZ
MDGFYDESCLTTKDKYAYFLSGNYADVSIRKITDEKRETLLVIKDSFVNSLVPFLAQNYDIRLIDPRQYTGKISDIVASGDYCAILCCINMDIISGSDVKIA